MSFLTNVELQERVRQAENKVEVGAQYFHYKKPNFDPYTVKAIVLIEETGQPAVLYSPTGGGGVMWVRKLENFIEEVEVNGQRVPRFRLADES